MSLQSFQQASLRLYTDTPFLERFASKPREALSEYTLTDREQQALINIPHDLLARFNRSLHAKSLGVAKRIIRGGNRVALLPFHTEGPALMWLASGGAPQFMSLSRGTYELMHRLCRKKQPFTIGALLSEQAQAPSATPYDAMRLTMTMMRYRLQGAIIRVPLVL